METTQPKVETIKVKYNKEEREIPIEEAAVLAQKGMNYDKVTERLKATEAELNQYREQIGGYQSKEARWQAEQEVKSLLGDGIDEAVARQLVDAKTKATLSEQELNQFRAKAAVDNQINTFRSERPDVNLEAIPDEVIEAAKKSGNLLKEFNAWESSVLRSKLADLEKQLGIKQANETNSGSSMGSVDTKGSAAPIEINDDTVKKMSSEQRRKLLEDKSSPLWKWINKPKT